jgi:hypothetical protein
VGYFNGHRRGQGKKTFSSSHRGIGYGYHIAWRRGAGLTAFDYARVKDLPPLESEGAHSLEEMWRNVTYFLKAV